MYGKMFKRYRRGRKGRKFGGRFWFLVTFLLIVMDVVNEVQSGVSEDKEECQQDKTSFVAGSAQMSARGIVNKIRWNTVDSAYGEVKTPKFRQHQTIVEFRPKKGPDIRQNGVSSNGVKDAIVIIGILTLTCQVIFVSCWFIMYQKRIVLPMKKQIVKLNGEKWKLTMAYHNLEDKLEDFEKDKAQKKKVDCVEEGAQTEQVLPTQVNRKRKVKMIRVKHQKIDSDKNRKILKITRRIKVSYQNLVKKYEQKTLNEEKSKVELEKINAQYNEILRLNAFQHQKIKRVEADFAEYRRIAEIQQADIFRDIESYFFDNKVNENVGFNVNMTSAEVQTEDEVVEKCKKEDKKKSRNRWYRVRKRVSSIYNRAVRKTGKPDGSSGKKNSLDAPPMIDLGPAGDFIVLVTHQPKQLNRFKKFFTLQKQENKIRRDREDGFRPP